MKKNPKVSQLPHGSRPNTGLPPSSHCVDLKHSCSPPVKQSPSCVQHNTDVDIFKWEIIRMTSLPLQVPDGASTVRFSHWHWPGIRNQESPVQYLIRLHRANSPSDLCATCLSSGPLFIVSSAHCILVSFTVNDYVERTEMTCIVRALIIISCKTPENL